MTLMLIMYCYFLNIPLFISELILPDFCLKQQDILLKKNSFLAIDYFKKNLQVSKSASHLRGSNLRCGPGCRRGGFYLFLLLHLLCSGQVLTM